MICPNINSPEFKYLQEALGTTGAYKVFISNNYNLPPLEDCKNIVLAINDSSVQYTFKSVSNLVNNLSKVQQWEKQIKDTDILYQKIQKDLQIPKEQIELLKQSEGNNIEEKLLNFVANYSYAIEINTAKAINDEEYFEKDGKYYFWDKYAYVSGGEEHIEITKKQYEEGKYRESTKYYSNLTVLGGKPETYREVNFETLLIKVPKSHAQFNTENTIGFTRGDDRIVYTENDIDKLINIMQKSGVLEVKC